MPEDRILVALSDETVELIDENRDDLSRWKFIEFCINEYFESIMEEEDSERTAKERVSMHLPKEVVALVDENRGSLCRWKFIEHCINSYSGNIAEGNPEHQKEKAPEYIPEKKKMKEHTRFLEGEKEAIRVPWKRKFDSMWLGAFLFYGAGDVISSYVAFGRAWVAEGNPVLRYLLGDNIYAFIPFKILILVSLFLISYYYLQNKFTSLFIPSLLIFVGVLISIKNLSYI